MTSSGTVGRMRCPSGCGAADGVGELLMTMTQIDSAWQRVPHPGCTVRIRSDIRDGCQVATPRAYGF